MFRKKTKTRIQPKKKVNETIIAIQRRLIDVERKKWDHWNGFRDEDNDESN